MRQLSTVLVRVGHEQGDAPQLTVLRLFGSLGELEWNSLKFASWMQERSWRITFFAPPATTLVYCAEEWFVPLDTLAVCRGLVILFMIRVL